MRARNMGDAFGEPAAISTFSRSSAMVYAEIAPDRSPDRVSESPLSFHTAGVDLSDEESVSSVGVAASAAADAASVDPPADRVA